MLLKAVLAFRDGVIAVRDGLDRVVEQLNFILAEYAPSGLVDQITDKAGRLLARVFESTDKLTIMPLETLQVKADDPAVQRFLIPKVLERLKEKKELNYAFEADYGFLKVIRVEGKLSSEDKAGLRRAVAWTLEKASSR